MLFLSIVKLKFRLDFGEKKFYNRQQARKHESREHEEENYWWTD